MSARMRPALATLKILPALNLRSSQLLTLYDKIPLMAGKEFETIHSEISGVSLRAEAGVKPRMVRRTIEKLVLLARRHAERKFQIDNLTSQQEKSGEKIKHIARTHKGLRGVESKIGNFILNVFPRESIVWNIPRLKKSLGSAFSLVVSKDFVATISVPAGFQTNKGPADTELFQQVITQSMLDLGFSEEDLPKMMRTETIHRVDEGKLEELIASGQVRLLKGTRQAKENWAITVAPLNPK
jgi:hypothetical protein